MQVTADGVSGLARAFLVAGARSVVMAQWPLDDSHTAGMMCRLYDMLIEGDRPIATCLANVQREEAGRSTEMELWAGFSYIGPPGLVLGIVQGCASPQPKNTVPIEASQTDREQPAQVTSAAPSASAVKAGQISLLSMTSVTAGSIK